MADYFCDHGAYGVTTNRLGLDVPVTWGVPQEGDGASKDASTAAAVASITFGAGPTSGVLSVCGISISNAGMLGQTAAAAATALAANINANSTVVSAAVATGQPSLHNLVYARAVGARVDIMMRIGSTTLNYATNANCGIASTFDGAPSLVQFVGGLGGCWGCFWTNDAFGVGGDIGVRQYGMLVRRPYVIYRADPAIDDVIWVRTGGSNKTILIANTTAGYSQENFGQYTMTGHYVFDTNTKWTGDTSTGQLLLSIQQSAYNAFFALSFSPGTVANPFALTALRLGGFKIKTLTDNGNSGATTFRCMGYANIFTNIQYQDDSPAGTNATMWCGMDDYNGQNAIWNNCTFAQTAPRTTINPVAIPYSYQSPGHLSWFNCSFSWNITGITDPGPLLTTINHNGFGQYVNFQNCTFSGFAAGFSPYAGAYPFDNGTHDYSFDNCSGLKLAANYWGAPNGYPREDADGNRFFFNGAGANGAYRYENMRGVTEWMPSDATPFPTLTALLPDGVTPWSLRFIWLMSGVVTRSNPASIPAFKTINRLASGVKTIGLDLFVPSAIDFTALNGWLATASYVDNTGVARTEAMVLPAASGVTWTNSGLYAGYMAKRISLTTAYPVALNSMVSIDIKIAMAPSTGVRADLYFNPDPSIVSVP